MNAEIACRVLRPLLSTASVAVLLGGVCSAQSPGLTLWYQQPASLWSEALPIGNGHVGAMVFGGANRGSNNGDQQEARRNVEIKDGKQTRAQDEHLQLNESTVWQGSRTDKLNPTALDGFHKVRTLLLESNGIDGVKIAEAERIAGQTMISKPAGMPGYSTLGDLYVRSADEAEVSGYRRELNLETGIATVTYTAGGVQFRREAFASAPDRVMVLHLSAGKPGALTFSVAMDRPSDFDVKVLSDRDLALTEGPAHAEQIRFQAQVRVLPKGGTIKREEKEIRIKGADEVTLLIAAATDFRGDVPAENCTAALDAAAKKQYKALRAAAVADEQQLMHRVRFQLGSADDPMVSVPTDERLKRVSAGATDLGLQSLYFQYARYLLTGSSRPGGLPANLQGLWASGISNPWGSKWTINVNTEMNYWIAEPANLGELTLPLVDWIDRIRKPGTGTGADVARKYYGARGFVIHHNTDIWGDAHPIDGVPYGIWPMGGAWLTLHAWDHYAFSGDRKFLLARAWPLLRENAVFFLDYLTDDGAGHLVTGPSLSPENRYQLPDGSAHSLTLAPTMDIEILRELFQRTVQASEVLNVDPAMRARVKDALDKLPKLQIGKNGNLQEWLWDYNDAEPGHRHISHLWGLFPGNQISMRETPELAEAARTTLQRRLTAGGGQTGWSRAWVVNYWAHLGEGEPAYDSMNVLFRQSTFPNLMDTHPPGVFQIDGNLGGANGMLETLVQSRWFPDHAEVDLLPALPNAWKSGQVSGIRVRGGADVAMGWDGGALRSVHWQASQDMPFQIHVPAAHRLTRLTANGKTQSLPTVADGKFRLDARKGVTYELGFAQ